MTFHVGAFATIQDAQGRALLCHRRDGDFWCQPGGGVESGETPWQAMARETREETGLEINVARLIGVSSWPATDELILSFHCVVTGGALALNDEARDLSYFALDALPPNTFAEHAERLRDAVRVLAALNALDALDDLREALRLSAPLLLMPHGPSAPEELRRAIAHRAGAFHEHGE